MNNLPMQNRPFWIDQWNKFIRINHLRASHFDTPSIWDRMAKNYKRDENDDSMTEKREEALVSQLLENEILFPGARVLDVGCGPGNYANLFAREGADVVAVDISGEMIRRLEDETPKLLKRQIRTITGDWRNVNLREFGFFKGFDLVFANMTPAVSNPDGFLKLIEASKGWCFNATWVGRRKNHPLDQLAEELQGTSPVYRSMYFIFAFNLLISCGYLPITDYLDTSWEKEENLEDVFIHFLDYFQRNPQIKDKNLETKIRVFLEKKCINGKIHKSSSGIIGRLCWNVNKQFVV